MKDLYLVVYKDHTSDTYTTKPDKKDFHKRALCFICQRITTIGQLNTFIYIDLLTGNNLERKRFTRIW